MSVNKNRPHVFVLPEDDANRQLADAFHEKVDWDRYRQMQVLEEAGGWHNVLHLFESTHRAEMDRYPYRFMVLLIDFDNDVDRLDIAKATIPDRLTDRDFILGCLSEPEALKTDRRTSYETIGSEMAKACQEPIDKVDTIWEHPLLQHNKGELERLREHICPILFEPI